MSLLKIFALVALAGSVILMNFKSFSKRSLESFQGWVPILALLASVIEVVLVFKLMKMPFLGANALLILGGVLAVTGAYLYRSAAGKMMSTAAAFVAFVGILQVLGKLNIIQKL